MDGTKRRTKTSGSALSDRGSRGGQDTAGSCFRASASRSDGTTTLYDRVPESLPNGTEIRSARPFRCGRPPDPPRNAAGHHDNDNPTRHKITRSYTAAQKRNSYRIAINSDRTLRVEGPMRRSGICSHSHGRATTTGRGSRGGTTGSLPAPTGSVAPTRAVSVLGTTGTDALAPMASTPPRDDPAVHPRHPRPAVVASSYRWSRCSACSRT